MKELIRFIRGIGWIAYFSILGFAAGILLGAAIVGNQREKAGYEKAMLEIHNLIHHEK